MALKRIQSLQLFTCGKQLLIFTLRTHALLVEAIAHSERPFTTLTTLALPAFCMSHKAYPAKFVIFESNFKREKSDLQHQAYQLTMCRTLSQIRLLSDVIIK